MLSQLIYVSNRKESTGPTELEAIVKAGERNNPELGVTGVLLYSEKKFIGFWEGEYENVMKIYQRVKKDPRHEDIKLISVKKNTLKTRLFPTWLMGGRNVNTDEVKLDSNHPEELN